MPRAVILGCAGPALTPEEAGFFRDADPLGFIVFTRNIQTPDQARGLIFALRDAVGRDAPVLIDQEGGRAARLKPPYWPVFPAAGVFGALALRDPEKALEACRLNAGLIGHELAKLEIDVNCAPVLDVLAPDAHDAIGDRAFGHDAATVSALGRAACEGLMQAGVLPVIKHMPGQGRAMVDSHHDLPIVTQDVASLDESDFAPFRTLADMPLGMVAHVVYTAIDAERCASTSPVIVRDILRGRLGFSGVLIADDISMQALSGSVRDRAAATLASGIDLTLHCNGHMTEMQSLMPVVPEAAPHVLHQLKATRDRLGYMSEDHAVAGRARLAELMG